MKNVRNKGGISLIVLVITVIILAIISTITIISVQSSNIRGIAKDAVNDVRLLELQTAANHITSDYYLLNSDDEVLATKTLKQYVEDRLVAEYNLTDAEKNIIEITELGEVKKK